MVINRAALKLNAKTQMRAAKPHVCLVALVYYVISWLLATLSERVMGMHILQDAIYNIQDPEILTEMIYNSFSLTGYILSIALGIVSAILSVGFVIYALNVSRLKKAGIGDLFDGFGIFFRALWLSILIGIFVALWSLLFFIPGIIAAYRYRQALYIMIDNPGKSALQCIRESKLIMKGHKWELFVLDLSFIGWSLLCVIPFVSIWVSPYMEVTYANYYQALLGLPFVQNDGFQSQDSTDDRPPWEL